MDYFILFFTIFVSYNNNKVNVTNNIYYENGYVCDKFFQVNPNYIDVSTNEKVENVIGEIHTYCPSDVYKSEYTNINEIVKIYPQLKMWNFNEHFIRSYPTKNGNVAYIYFKKK